MADSASVPAGRNKSPTPHSKPGSPRGLSFTGNIILCYWPLSLLSLPVLMCNEGASPWRCHFSAASGCRGDVTARGSGAWPIIFHLNQIRQAFSANASTQYLFSSSFICILHISVSLIEREREREKEIERKREREER